MSIKGYLLEVAAKKRNALSPNIEAVPAEVVKKARDLWHNFEGETSTVSMGAVDGSLNKKEYLGFVVYAVASASVMFDCNGTEKERESYNVEIDILKPLEYSEARIRLLMGILEIKELIKLNKEENPELLLIDGSIVGDIIRPVPFFSWIREEDKKFVEEHIFPELKKSFSLNKINAKTFYKEISSMPPEAFPIVAGYLEYLEYLLSIKKLFETATDKIVAVSKRSSSRIYNFNSIMPDIFLFQIAGVKPGYSHPIEITISPEKKYQFPEMFEDFFRTKKMNMFFAKFSTDVYKIETTMNPERIMSALMNTIINGYPFPLKLAHDTVKIDNQTMEKIISILAVNFRTGREGVD
ncbi:DNA double-strand break repair nuclease NurA [Desulfurobacterium sp.]